jgi:hypothetical protein
MPLDGLAVPKGPTIIEIIWAEMDAAYERLIADGEPDNAQYSTNQAAWAVDYQRYGEQRGQCQGLAYALAVLHNPYRPNVGEIKAEAKRRHEERAA